MIEPSLLSSLGWVGGRTKIESRKRKRKAKARRSKANEAFGLKSSKIRALKLTPKY